MGRRPATRLDHHPRKTIINRETPGQRQNPLHRPETEIR
uniref:SCP domain-containing protein n=1 Tax=Parascaris univalens TaxID=6257 RepID=A0A915C7X1_PARUN